MNDKNIEPITVSNTEIKIKNEDNEEWLMIGGLTVGMSIGFITENLMWETTGAFLGLGLGDILQGIRKK